MSDEEASPRYIVTQAERVEADREAAFLRLLSYNSDYAARWLRGLLDAIEKLPEFPGPLSHAIDSEASNLFGVEVRRMLYHGPQRKRGRVAYRVLFTILPGDGPGESIIHVLRVLHGAQLLTPLLPGETTGE